MADEQRTMDQDEMRARVETLRQATWRVDQATANLKKRQKLQRGLRKMVKRLRRLVNDECKNLVSGDPITSFLLWTGGSVIRLDAALRKLGDISVEVARARQDLDIAQTKWDAAYQAATGLLHKISRSQEQATQPEDDKR